MPSCGEWIHSVEISQSRSGRQNVKYCFDGGSAANHKAWKRLSVYKSDDRLERKSKSLVLLAAERTADPEPRVVAAKLHDKNGVPVESEAVLIALFIKLHNALVRPSIRDYNQSFQGQQEKTPEDRGVDDVGQFATAALSDRTALR